MASTSMQSLDANKASEQATNLLLYGVAVWQRNRKHWPLLTGLHNVIECHAVNSLSVDEQAAS